MIGIDIENIARLERLMMRKPKILSRFFSSYEWQYAHKKARPAQTLAGFWCAKEAVVKAFSSFSVVLFVTDVEICHNNSNAPYVCFISDENLLNMYIIEVSISHTLEQATAVAMVQLK